MIRHMVRILHIIAYLLAILCFMAFNYKLQLGIILIVLFVICGAEEARQGEALSLVVTAIGIVASIVMMAAGRYMPRNMAVCVLVLATFFNRPGYMEKQGCRKKSGKNSGHNRVYMPCAYIRADGSLCGECV